LRITVRVYTFLREKLGWKEKEFEIPDGARLADLVKLVEELRSALGDNPLQGFHILVNGINVALKQGLETPLKDSDVVDIFPPAAGG